MTDRLLGEPSEADWPTDTCEHGVAVTRVCEDCWEEPGDLMERSRHPDWVDMDG